MNRRWIFVFGFLSGAVVADLTHPARAQETGCGTDAECYEQCMARSDGGPEMDSECGDVLGEAE